MMNEAVLTAKELCIGYRTRRGEQKIHEHLSFQLYPGELTSVLGANGVGKSTLLRTLAASQPALSGEISLLGKPLNEYTERERSRAIGIVLTDKIQAGGLTVYELVALGRQPHTGFFGRLHEKDHALIRQALQAVGIAYKAESYTAELSDGERQKVMIAKALVQECPLIILDEPTAFLDAVSRIDIMTLLHKLAVEQRKAILLSTHDIEQALVLSDKLWLLSAEEGLRCGTTEDLILDHCMDNLFSHSNIHFDYHLGSYFPAVESFRQMVVKTADEEWLHWTMNALHRHNYTCLLEDETGTLPCVEVTAPHQLKLTQAGQSQTFTFFSELLKHI